MADAFGRAIRDFHRDGLDKPLVQRDGEETLDHPIEEFYFGSFDAEGEEGAWIEAQVDGPLLDIGAGAGRDTLYFQDQLETVAIEVSQALVETMLLDFIRPNRGSGRIPGPTPPTFAVVSAFCRKATGSRTTSSVGSTSSG